MHILRRPLETYPSNDFAVVDPFLFNAPVLWIVFYPLDSVAVYSLATSTRPAEITTAGERFR